MKTIDGFKGEYRWLSNFAPVKIILDNAEYQSVEHAYMSAKSEDIEWKKFCADKDNSAGKVKKASKEIQLREDWNSIRLKTMEYCLWQKFTQQPYRKQLLNTDGITLYEFNSHHDNYFGICTCKTCNDTVAINSFTIISEEYIIDNVTNKLGHLIMGIRAHLDKVNYLNALEKKYPSAVIEVNGNCTLINIVPSKKIGLELSENMLKRLNKLNEKPK